MTTSTRDSGLLDILVPPFEQQQNVRVDIIAVGTGKALKLGEAGDVDVVFVHARAAEDAFMAAGHGTRREDVMYNTFELLGPPDDPAQIRDKPSTEALRLIAEGGHRFASRGDDSGTHKRELKLWAEGGGRPEWSEYFESGQGMGPTLVMAEQKQAYVITDRGTYLKFQSKVSLIPLATPDDTMKNPYGIMVVNPDKSESIQPKLANAFVDYIVSPEAKTLIEGYTIDGEQLFFPIK